MSETAFHATMDFHGEQMVFDRGGRYEKVREEGTPVQNIIGGEFCGFARSDVEELAASTRPECAVFAVLKNYVNDTGDGSGLCGSIRVNVYQLEREFDIDMRKSVAGDFSLNKEVRFRNLEDDPVTGELAHTVVFPGRVLGDVELTYLPCGGGTNGVIRSWGKQVQQAIRQCIETGEYPEDVTSVDGVDRPDVEAYIPTH